MIKANLVVGDIVVFKSPKEIEREYGCFDENGWVKVGTQSYGIEMYNEYKDYLYSIERIEGDRLFFFRPRDLWQKVTKGMVKRIYKREKR